METQTDVPKEPTCEECDKADYPAIYHLHYTVCALCYTRAQEHQFQKQMQASKSTPSGRMSNLRTF